jgi:flavodoxin
MRILVGYESRGGRTGRTAEAIAEAGRKEGHTVVVRPLAQVGSDELLDQELLFLGTWVEGYILFGVGPARTARRLIEALPPLGGKPAAVFCTYAIHPRGTLGMLRSALELKGAKVVGQRAFHRNRPEQGADVFTRDVLAVVSPT